MLDAVPFCIAQSCYMLRTHATSVLEGIKERHPSMSAARNLSRRSSASTVLEVDVSVLLARPA